MTSVMMALFFGIIGLLGGLSAFVMIQAMGHRP